MTEEAVNEALEEAKRQRAEAVGSDGASTTGSEDLKEGTVPQGLTECLQALTSTLKLDESKSKEVERLLLLWRPAEKDAEPPRKARKGDNGNAPMDTEEGNNNED